MEIGAFEPTEDNVIAAHQSGSLTSLIFSYKTSRAEDFQEVCIDLHNRNIIDLLSLTETQAFTEVDAHNFFAGQHFFTSCIPHLVAPTIEMMRCVKALVLKAGTDGAANLPYAAFKKWCLADLHRAAQVISKARDGDTLSIDFLTLALTAGFHHNEAKRFANDYTGDLQICGISALGRMNYEDKQTANDALDTLLNLSRMSNDDRLRATAMLASLDIGSKARLTGATQIRDIVQLACESSSDAMHSACATAFFSHCTELSSEIAGLLLQRLATLDPKHLGALKQLDLGLGQTMGGDSADLSLAFLMKYLVRHEGTISLSDFATSKSAISINERTLHRFIVECILSGEHVLCESIADILRSQDEKPVELSASELDLRSDQLEFFCLKLIGYLFIHPVVLCSIFASVLRECDDQLAAKLTHLLFDPILRNFGGKARDYLSAISPDDCAYSRVAPALKKASDYVEMISSVGEIKELHPSEIERQTVNSRDFDEMQKARNDAMKRSVLFSLVSRSAVLHGRRTMTYVDNGAEKAPIEMELHSHSFEIEMPRINVYDPVGLEFELLMYRILRARS